MFKLVYYIGIRAVGKWVVGISEMASCLKIILRLQNLYYRTLAYLMKTEDTSLF